jgi:hypothetical protein
VTTQKNSFIFIHLSSRLLYYAVFWLHTNVSAESAASIFRVYTERVRKLTIYIGGGSCHEDWPISHMFSVVL